MIAPMMISWIGLGCLSAVQPLEITCMISAPVKVPRIEPRPPLRLPPPITTAAMIGNSLPVPDVGSPIVSRAN